MEDSGDDGPVYCSSLQNQPQQHWSHERQSVETEMETQAIVVAVHRTHLHQPSDIDATFAAVCLRIQCHEGILPVRTF